LLYTKPYPWGLHPRGRRIEGERDNRILNRICGSERKKHEAGVFSKMISFTTYCYDTPIKDETGVAFDTHTEEVKQRTYNILVGKPNGNKALAMRG
jgi:hypothetical protein